MADEMLRQRCTSGDEHQYHIDQMKNFLKSEHCWKGSSGPEKIVLSLHKFPAIIFNDDDIEETRLSRWLWNKKTERAWKTKGSDLFELKDHLSYQDPDYKNLNKNDIENMYLLIMNGKRSYNDVKYGYIQRDLTNDEVEYLKLFEEEIEVRLKDRNQMIRWEMYVNGRPLGP
ncbi:hypothetical protein Tco_1483323 [Tanacetum coccineum]